MVVKVRKGQRCTRGIATEQESIGRGDDRF